MIERMYESLRERGAEMDEPIRAGVSPVEEAFAALVASARERPRVTYLTRADLRAGDAATSYPQTRHSSGGRPVRRPSTRIVLRAGMDLDDPTAARPVAGGADL
ncbi:hypothetical protein [Antribacter gilvus]|uniref:hypothetical protein n=1 Tax=Antribacter gilvus TaxID=2304675 RepID=UPI000F775D07|nr:hypothetical protein [Antribacter gilvus]